MKAYEELDDWAKAERLGGLASSIRIKGAQHHASIEAVLCSRCEHGMVYRQGSGNSTVRAICNLSRVEVPEDIVECSQFESKAKVTVTLEDMAKLAVTIDPRPLPGKNLYL